MISTTCSGSGCRTCSWAAVALAAVAVVVLTGCEIELIGRNLYPAVDFFQTPRAFDNLLHGNNMFLTRLSDYSIYATPYFYHPMVALVVGPWTTPFDPWTAFLLFVGMSFVLLFFCGRLLASNFEQPGLKAFCYGAMFFSVPIYLMLWIAQSHVFVIFALTLILCGIMRLYEDEKNAKRYLFWIQAGLLISLFSKPMVLLLLPALFASPQIRWKLFAPIAIYAAVSFILLLVEPLNPGDLNGFHWLAIVRSSSSPCIVLDCVFPQTFNLLQNYHVYSLPVFLARVFNETTANVIAKLFLLIVLAMSLLPLVVRERREQLRLTLVAACLCILSLYLCHYSVNEYYYAAVLPVLPVLLWLRQREEHTWFSRTLLIGFVALLAIFLPTAHILDNETRQSLWMLSTAQRVAPVLVGFVCLTLYGAARAASAVDKNVILALQETHQPLRRTIVQGGMMAALLGVVFAVALFGMPERFRKSPDAWTVQDWKDQLAFISNCHGPFPRDVDIDLRLSLQVFENIQRQFRQVEPMQKSQPPSPDIPPQPPQT